MHLENTLSSQGGEDSFIFAKTLLILVGRGWASSDYSGHQPTLTLLWHNSALEVSKETGVLLLSGWAMALPACLRRQFTAQIPNLSREMESHLGRL